MNNPVASPLVFEDFSGGLTDNIVSNNLTQAEKYSNLFITDEKKPRSRHGSLIFSGSGQITAGTVPIRGLYNWNNNDTLLIATARKVYTNISDTWTELIGPTSNSVFSAGTSAAHFAFSEWKTIVLGTTDASSFPALIYKDGGGTINVVTAGLPAIADTDNFTYATQLTNCITLANEVRTDMLVHFANTTRHTGGADTVAAALVAAAASTTLGQLVTLTNSLARAHQVHWKDSYKSTPSFHSQSIGPEDSEYYQWEYGLSRTADFSSSATTADLPAIALHLNDLKSKYNKHAAHLPIHDSVAYVGAETVTTADIVELTSGITVAGSLTLLSAKLNAAQTAYIAHTHDASEHTAGVHSGGTDYTAVTVSTRLTAWDFWNAWVTHYMGLHDADAELNVGWAYHAASETADHSFGGEATAPPPNTTYYTIYQKANAETLEQFVTTYKAGVTQFNAHDSDPQAHGTNEGAHQLEVLDIEVGDWVYAFHYFYEFTVGTTTFNMVGPVTLRVVEDVPSPDFDAVTISNIPTLSNSTTENYNTTSVKIKIYRTKKDSTNLFYLDTISNGTSSYTDRASDDDLSTEQIYTAGGVVDFEPAPKAKYSVINEDKAFYLSITDGAETFPQRLIQSIPGAPWACSSTFFVDLDDPGRGIGAVRNRVIAFSTKSVYRIDGSFDELGQGGIQAVKISDVTGLQAHSSIVPIENGLLFAGTDGFYYTDGFTVQKLSNHLNTTYALLTNTATKRSNMVGTYDSLKQLVYWGAQFNDQSADNDIIYTLHLKYGLREESSFTQMSSEGDWAPTALCMFAQQMIRADRRGYIFKHGSSYRTDPVIDTAVSPSLWATKAIIYEWKSVATNCGTEDFRKFGTRCSVVLENETNMSVALNYNDDLSSRTREMKPLRFRGNCLWGDALVAWGELSMFWYFQREMVDIERTFLAGGLRFRRRQIYITNAFTNITNSDSMSTAVVNGTSNTLTFTDTATDDWPTDVVGYYITLEHDDYTEQYPVVSRDSADQITVTDANGTLPTGTYKWVLKGYPKNELFHLHSYSMFFYPLSRTSIPFAGGSMGANA